MVDISIVVPVYNAKGVKRIIDSFDILKPLPVEIILVDDCSENSSFFQTELAALPESSVIYFRMAKNVGQDKSTRFGITHANGKYIVTIDDDLEFPSVEIKKLYDTILKSGADIVYGMPSKPKNSTFRVVTRKFYYVLINLLGYPMFSSFRIIDQKLKPAVINAAPVENFCLDKLLLSVTKNVMKIEVDYQPKAGTRYSKYKLFKKFLIFFTYHP